MTYFSQLNILINLLKIYLRNTIIYSYL